MIFLTVGSWHKGFDRLIEAVDKLKEQEVVTEEVIAQVGPGKYQPKGMRVMDYCSPDAFRGFVAEARVIIAHAGLGAIALAIQQGKPIVVVPRKASLGEVSDDHQFTTAKWLEAEGKVLVAYETEDLPSKLQRAETFVPVRSTGSENIRKAVEEFLEDIAAKKRR